MSDKPVTLAAVTGAHGVTGEVRLKLLGEGYEALKPHKSFNGGSLNLTKLRSDNKGGAIARFAEVADRTAAEHGYRVAGFDLGHLRAEIAGRENVREQDCLVIADFRRQLH